MAIKDSVYVNVVTNADKAGKNMLKFAGGIAAATAALVGIYKIGKDLIEVYKVQEQAEAKLKAAIRATGKESEISFENMTALASSLQQVTTYGDEATISAMAMLQQLADLNQKGLEKIIPGVLDFAQAMNVDLQTAATLIGKTIGSDTNALARYGLAIDMSGTKTEKLASLTQALEDRFGGMAKAIADTATGAMVQLSNAYGDMREAAGKNIAEGLRPFVEKLTEIIKKAAEASTSVAELRAILEKEKRGEALTLLEQQTKLIGELAEIEGVQAGASLGWTSKNIIASKKYNEKVAERKKAIEDELKLIESKLFWTNTQTQAQKELSDEEVKRGIAIEKLGKVESESIKRINELYEEGLAPKEYAILLIDREVAELVKARKEARKYSEDFSVGQERINLLLDKKKEIVQVGADEELAIARALLDEEIVTANKKLELAQELADKKTDIERKYQIAVMDEQDAALAYLEDRYAEELKLAIKVGASTVDLVEAYAKEKLEIIKEYADKERDIEKEKLEAMKDDFKSWAETAMSTYAMAFGAMLVGAEGAAEGIKGAMKSAIVSILKMLAAWAFAEAMIKVSNPLTMPQGVALFAASAGASAAAGAVNAMERGGIIDEPVYGIGQSGQRYLFGESGPEEIRPVGRSAPRVTFNIHGNSFMGAGGVREFVLEIRKEFNSLDTLGL